MIKEVQWNEQAFDTLILPDSQKLILRALVSSHAFSRNARDQVQQKGKESGAEITEKGMLSTTTGDLNKYNRPWYIEYRLPQLLRYATIWKAVVLLDEADVFLEARQDCLGDATARNALVAIFLRYLEYFSSIMFLTSNRVGVFDDAMKSRIHLAIEYLPPTLEMRRLIWIERLQAIPASETAVDPEEAVHELIRDDLNGREFYNAVRTAQTVARFEVKSLQLSHIETVLKVRREFEASIHRTKRAWIAKSKQEDSFGVPNRQNSLLMSTAEPSEWLP
ncbi:hypothetical protein MMC18_004800 [Xylographa bjoerkii]|nr:hypothetical protein [Xylographa bjoerkii]